MKEVLEYYMNHTDEKLKEIQRELQKMNNKLDSLNNFKWKISGALAVIFFLGELAKSYFFKGG